MPHPDDEGRRSWRSSTTTGNPSTRRSAGQDGSHATSRHHQPEREQQLDEAAFGALRVPIRPGPAEGQPRPDEFSRPNRRSPRNAGGSGRTRAWSPRRWTRSSGPVEGGDSRRRDRGPAARGGRGARTGTRRLYRLAGGCGAYNGMRRTPRSCRPHRVRCVFMLTSAGASWATGPGVHHPRSAPPTAAACQAPFGAGLIDDAKRAARSNRRELHTGVASSGAGPTSVGHSRARGGALAESGVTRGRGRRGPPRRSSTMCPVGRRPAAGIQRRGSCCSS
jgi:hypothetical protein